MPSAEMRDGKTGLRRNSGRRSDPCRRATSEYFPGCAPATHGPKTGAPPAARARKSRPGLPSAAPDPSAPGSFPETAPPESSADAPPSDGRKPPASQNRSRCRRTTAAPAHPGTIPAVFSRSQAPYRCMRPFWQSSEPRRPAAPARQNRAPGTDGTARPETSRPLQSSPRK